jgi:hypothetical protein
VNANPNPLPNQYNANAAQKISFSNIGAWAGNTRLVSDRARARGSRRISPKAKAGCLGIDSTNNHQHTPDRQEVSKAHYSLDGQTAVHNNNAPFLALGKPLTYPDAQPLIPTP